MSDVLPPAMTHGKHSKAILLGTIAGGGVLLYLFMHRSAAAQVAPATPAATDTPVDVSGMPNQGYGGYSNDGYSDGGSSGDLSTTTDNPPLTIGSTDVAPVAPSAPAKHRTVRAKATHPAQTHANPVQHANVRHKNEVMNSHHGGTNASAHTAHHASPVPASNHHRVQPVEPRHPAPAPAPKARKHK